MKRGVKQRLSPLLLNDEIGIQVDSTNRPGTEKDKSDTAQSWWRTSCEVCNRWRLIILWGLIMWFVYDYFWL